MDIDFAVNYEDCPCVGLRKEFNMSVLCQKCYGSNKMVHIKEEYKNIFFVCHICNGYGNTVYDVCERCNGKGYLDWISEVIK